MKITNLRAIQPVAENSPPDWRTSLGQILIAIDTDRGLTGYGVGGGGLGGLARGPHGARRSALGPLARTGGEPLGRNVRRHLAVRTKRPGDHGLKRRGLGVMGSPRQSRRKSLWRNCLGGRVGNPIPTYITVWDGHRPRNSRKSHTAFKLHIPPVDPARRIGDAIRTRRAGQSGDRLGKINLMIDCWMKWDLPGTLSAADGIGEIRPPLDRRTAARQ